MTASSVKNAKGMGGRASRRLLKRIKQHGSVLKVGVFSGRGVYRQGKLLFFLAKAAQCFVYNVQLDGYWLTLRSLPLLFRREPLLFGLEETKEKGTPVVVFQTEAAPYVKVAIGKIREPKLYPDARVLVVGRQEEQAGLAKLPGVVKVLTYRKGMGWRASRDLLREIRRHRSVLKVGVFSG